MKYSIKIRFTSTVNKTKFQSVLKIKYEPIENQPFIVDASWRKGILGSSAYNITLLAKSFEHTWEVVNEYTDKSFVIKEDSTEDGYNEKMKIYFQDSFGSVEFFHSEPVID